MRNFVVMLGTVGTLAAIGGEAIAKPQPIKPLPPNLVAGTYERTIAGYPATLIVKNAGKKIDFTLTASVEHPRKASATLSAVVPFVNNIAIFEKKDKTAQYSLSMRFSGPAVIVICDGTGFGGNGIDPAGVYRRVNAPAKNAKP